MSDSYDVHVGAVGWVLTLTVTDASTGLAVDLTDADTADIILRGPSGPRLTKTGTVVGDPTTGVLGYTTVAGDIAQPGAWRAQAHVVLEDETEFWSSVLEFTVGPNL